MVFLQSRYVRSTQLKFGVGAGWVVTTPHPQEAILEHYGVCAAVGQYLVLLLTLAAGRIQSTPVLCSKVNNSRRRLAASASLLVYRVRQVLQAGVSELCSLCGFWKGKFVSL